MAGGAGSNPNVRHSASYARYATLDVHRAARRRLPPPCAESSSRPEPVVPAHLDDIDRNILRELQDNGQITNVELARRVGISAPPCLRRGRGLAGAGYN